MYTLIIILILIVCLLLVGVVMVQNSKGGGLASDFSSSNQIIGVQRTGDFLEKATWYLSIALIVLTLGSNFFINRGEVVQEESAIQEQIDNAALPATDDLGESGPIEE
ncbi:MAG: preprotein translocase subunit SecG [Flavobacteriales bacterium]|nr:preprotein translocase subunit SecG [Flavobacteriales bacterium]MCB9190978.1 preprotein translocase subunit SecG [Flavobacteriales bacterium]MCB9204787.1 preprotein translocase subunit SecG [Flavobacteriales bacterium]